MSGAGLDVVVIDDEPDVVAYLAAVLEQRGHRPHVASDAAAGFDLIVQLQPDVACVDVVMPEETGVSLLRRIRQDDRVSGVPVVFITALKPEPETDDDQVRAYEPDGFIEKPPDAAALIQTIEQVARGQP
jgi:CheY-like chemotaxis protein